MQSEGEGFAVYSDCKFLFLIGKICATAGSRYAEEGLRALNDYLKILTYYKHDMYSDVFEKMRLKTYFYIGCIFYDNGDYEYLPLFYPF